LVEGRHEKSISLSRHPVAHCTTIQAHSYAICSKWAADRQWGTFQIHLHGEGPVGQPLKKASPPGPLSLARVTCFGLAHAPTASISAGTSGLTPGRTPQQRSGSTGAEEFNSPNPPSITECGNPVNFKSLGVYPLFPCPADFHASGHGQRERGARH